ncbi:MAG: hypothetical protein AAF810_04865 [Cyanobacteria bacterium P01_D01_bin.36]
MTTTILTKPQPEVITEQYIYATHPAALTSKHTYRVMVDIKSVSLLVDLLMPNDGKPLGKRIENWCKATYNEAPLGWWTAVEPGEF